MTQDRIKSFQNQLLNWYDKSARTLPWRDFPTPYRVWISEIMLQQTRVDTVKPYFEKFIQEVPDIETLANISEDHLLKLWQGLGYYNRGLNLKKAAQLVLEKFNGEIPKNIDDLKKLPGIGDYSAGAIASIAFGERATAVDGNVLRVMARITSNTRDVLEPKVKKFFKDEVFELLPAKRVGDFNQALMELGATICIPNGKPHCKACPMANLCEAYQTGIEQNIPVKTPKNKRRVEKKTVFLMECNDFIGIRRRKGEGLLPNLWEFPNEEDHLTIEECEKYLKKWDMSIQKIQPLPKSKHIFTHIEWDMIGYHVFFNSIDDKLEITWSTKNDIKEKFSIPSAFKTYLKLISEKKYNQ
jgi:A/G-specific adenine glycosylase